MKKKEPQKRVNVVSLQLVKESSPFIDSIVYDKTTKTANIKLTNSQQVLSKIEDYNENKASIPTDGIDAFHICIVTKNH
ncbi:hypothetical protein GM526_13240 [Enterococcus avium]|uniref:hypothetical protein n=1 Tax=Enterococcus avium TaxID=33945 RepID=UPI00159DBDAD|nr:hypothetical protein [Enterococcus avium]NVN78023.1 hypothetical protein [Enterococcus avium]